MKGEVSTHSDEDNNSYDTASAPLPLTLGQQCPTHTPAVTLFPSSACTCSGPRRTHLHIDHTFLVFVHLTPWPPSQPT